MKAMLACVLMLGGAMRCHGKGSSSSNIIGCGGCGCAQVGGEACTQCYRAAYFQTKAERSCANKLAESCQETHLLHKLQYARTYAQPYISEQFTMCGPTTRGSDLGKYVDIPDSGMVVVRVDGTNPVEYLPDNSTVEPQVEYPGGYDAMNNPNNRYTNYTCARRYCRMVRVYRSGSGYACADGQLDLDGTCYVKGMDRDDALPLCHNNTALACAFWEPSSFDWVVVVPELVVFLVAMVGVVVAMFVRDKWWKWEEQRPASIFVLWSILALTIIGTIGLIAAHQMLHFMADTQVDLQYVSYQGCRRHCDFQVIEPLTRSAVFTQSNQCRDKGAECGSIPAGQAEAKTRLEYCYSCQAQKDAYLWLLYASQAGRALVWFYTALVVASLLPYRVMGFMMYNVVMFLVFLSVVLSLVMAGYVTDPGQRQVMRYALTMEGDSIYSLFVSASILEILGACAVVGWLASDELERLVNTRRAGYEKAPSSILDSVSITPADVSSASRRKKTDGDGEAVKSSVGKAWEL